MHHLDLIRFAYGREVEAVSCRTWNPAWSMYAHAANVSCLLTLEGGLEVNYLGTWTGGWNELKFEWRTDCENGVIVQRELFADLATAATGDAALTPYPIADERPFIDDTAHLLTEFIAAVRGGTAAALRRARPSADPGAVLCRHRERRYRTAGGCGGLCGAAWACRSHRNVRMTVLVTGASGFVGCHIVDALARLDPDRLIVAADKVPPDEVASAVHLAPPEDGQAHDARRHGPRCRAGAGGRSAADGHRACRRNHAIAGSGTRSTDAVSSTSISAG